MNATNSFLRFTFGFLIFISLSFAITYAVNSYTVAKETEQETAAAFQALLDSK